MEEDRPKIMACIVQAPGMPFMGTIMGLTAVVTNFDMDRIPHNPVLVVEGTTLPRVHQQGILQMVSSSIEILEEGIAQFESDNDSAHEPVSKNDADMFIAFGSRNFCQAFVHFWAIDKGGDGAGWGIHLIRHLSDAKPGDVLWRDINKPTIHKTTAEKLVSLLPKGFGT